jgi:glycosyltransferase involved in cell wall biosynthesis
MKRILFVDHTPFVGGAQLVIADHIRHLDRSRFTPLMACTPTVPALAERYRAAGAEVFYTPLPRLRVRSPVAVVRLLGAARELRRLMRRERADVVVANTSRAAYVASLAVRGTGVPLVWWVRDFLFGGLAFRLMGGAPARIVCVSQAIRDFYGGAGDPRFEVVYVGSDLYRRAAEVDDERIRAERARWGLSPEDVVVGFMGRLVEEKGVEDVVAAVREVHRTHPRVKLLVVGTGSHQQGDVEARVREAVAVKGLSYVRFAGYQADEALYYRLFDVFVLATRTGEPYATSVVQAMMAGRPVVGTATGGTPELVRDRETGMLVPPSEPRRMAAALRALLDEPGLAERVAAAGRDYVMANNREEVTTARVERLYDELARGR